LAAGDEVRREAERQRDGLRRAGGAGRRAALVPRGVLHAGSDVVDAVAEIFVVDVRDELPANDLRREVVPCLAGARLVLNHAASDPRTGVRRVDGELGRIGGVARGERCCRRCLVVEAQIYRVAGRGWVAVASGVLQRYAQLPISGTWHRE